MLFATLIACGGGIGLASNVHYPCNHSFPKVRLSNGLVSATIYLPDNKEGYYRGARFDWSGVIASVEYRGHQYHGEWFDQHDPLTHDGIVGPVEEFGPLGYDVADVGDGFVKIGVGRLIKPDMKPYVFHRPYVVADYGKWEIIGDAQRVSLTHVLEDTEYPYVYNKVVDLPPGEAKLVLEHTLENTGKKHIDTRVYNHNFFMIDGTPTGPAYRILVPGEQLSAQGAKGLDELVTLDGNTIGFLRKLKPREQAYFPDLAAGELVDYDIAVVNTDTGAGVRITGNQPISKMVFWSSPTTVCPEPYIDVRVAPGKSFSWQTIYHYYNANEKDK